MGFLPAELIKKKRDKKTHTPEEIQFLIREYSKGRIPDYQMSAWLMAVFFSGMGLDEMHALTQAMLHSGHVLDFSDLKVSKVDKHSTGGVGDKTSLILAPIVASAGVAVPMISGRGLGHTGGTLDKLESIPGFNTRLDEKAFKDFVSKFGLCFIGQTESICPADKKLYALRDVTATVESIPLICASIMSKKLAEGIDALVLDVKFGTGAFMKSIENAETLARNLMQIGKHAGKKVHALLTSMDQPLGSHVGNALEVRECLNILENQNSPEWQDTLDLSLELSAHMIFLAGAARNIESARDLALKLLRSGAALQKFEEICAAQGGNLKALPKSKDGWIVEAPQDGFVTSFDTEGVGTAALVLGAGRKTVSDQIDPTAGIKIHKKLGQKVHKGEPLYTLFGKSESQFEEACQRLLASTTISEQPDDSAPLISKVLLGTN